MRANNTLAGFTIIELLIVLSIVSLLLAGAVIAINPFRNFSQASNLQRKSDLEIILGGLNQYAIEQNGAFPAVVSTTLQMIGTATTGCNMACTATSSVTATACVNLASTLAPTYLSQLPVDPTLGSSTKTFYAIQRVDKGTGNIGLTLRACSPDLNVKIEINQ